MLKMLEMSFSFSMNVILSMSIDRSNTPKGCNVIMSKMSKMGKEFRGTHIFVQGM